jgi:hypothetical protein
MRPTILLLPLILACALSSCGVVNSAARTAGGILGVQAPEPAPTSELEEAVPRNEYHAACIRERREAIQEIVEGGDQ